MRFTHSDAKKGQKVKLLVLFSHSKSQSANLPTLMHDTGWMYTAVEYKSDAYQLEKGRLTQRDIDPNTGSIRFNYEAFEHEGGPVSIRGNQG